MGPFVGINPHRLVLACLALALAESTGAPLSAQEIKLPQLLKILPPIAYPNDDIRIQGSDFGSNPAAISLEVNGHPVGLKDCDSVNAALNGRSQSGPSGGSAASTPGQTAQAQGNNSPGAICASIHLDASPNEIDLTEITDAQIRVLSGLAVLKVKGDDGVVRASPTGVEIRWSSLTPSQVTEVSLGGGFLLGAVLLLLVTYGTRQVIDSGVRSGILTTFLLDPQTDTLSLSKFQFYVWTVAAISSYNYLLVSMLLVQKVGKLPDIPTNLPWIFASSIGTSIGIGAITMARGPKGAGEIRPRLSDLITMGGVVAPDRVQYLVWTIVGAIGYMLTIHSLDPRQISTLPSIPTSLLVLGGVSAAGYVGGRLASKVGPVVDTADLSIASTNAGPSSTDSQAAPLAAAVAVAPATPSASAPTPAPPLSMPISAVSSFTAIQKSLTASSQSLASLGPNNPSVALAVQKVQASIAKATPLVQFFSSAKLDPGSLGTLLPLMSDALKTAEEASMSVANLALANPGGNATEPNTLQSAAQTVDQVLHQVQLLSRLATQLSPPAPSPAPPPPPAPPPANANPQQNSSPRGQAPPDAGTMWVLTMRGRGLSRDATFSYADALTPSMEIDLAIPPFVPLNGSGQPAMDQLTASNGQANPEIVEQDTDSGNADMAKVLRVRFRSAAMAARPGQEGTWNFKISNPDGQIAVFAIDKPKS